MSIEEAQSNHQATTICIPTRCSMTTLLQHPYLTRRTAGAHWPRRWSHTSLRWLRRVLALITPRSDQLANSNLLLKWAIWQRMEPTSSMRTDTVAVCSPRPTRTCRCALTTPHQALINWIARQWLGRRRKLSWATATCHHLNKRRRSRRCRVIQVV